VRVVRSRGGGGGFKLHSKIFPLTVDWCVCRSTYSMKAERGDIDSEPELHRLETAVRRKDLFCPPGFIHSYREDNCYGTLPRTTAEASAECPPGRLR
jgi:hypothetical protein